MPEVDQIAGNKDPKDRKQKDLASLKETYIQNTASI